MGIAQYSVCWIFLSLKKISEQPVRRLSNSDLLVNSFTMVAYEKIFFSCPLDTKFWLN